MTIKESTEAVLDIIKTKANKEEWFELVSMLAYPHDTDIAGCAEYDSDTYAIIEDMIDSLVCKYKIIIPLVSKE